MHGVVWLEIGFDRGGILMKDFANALGGHACMDRMHVGGGDFFVKDICVCGRNRCCIATNFAILLLAII